MDPSNHDQNHQIPSAALGLTRQVWPFLLVFQGLAGSHLAESQSLNLALR